MWRGDDGPSTLVCCCRPRHGRARRRREVGGPVTMLDRRVRVAIRFPDGRMALQCAGPGPDSRCPLTDENDVVACAGAMIVALRGTIADGRPLTVDGSAGPRCPLARLVRDVPAPWD
jgi:hypothetical protein